MKRGNQEAPIKYIHKYDQNLPISSIYYNSQKSCYHGPMLEFQNIDKSDNKRRKLTEDQNSTENIKYLCSYDRKISFPNCKINEEEEAKKLDKFKSSISKIPFRDIKKSQPIKHNLLNYKTENSKNAQYILSNRSNQFIYEQIISKFDQIICIGTPKIHEMAISSSTKSIKSILLDIDQRFQCFWPESYFKFNMFNCHFFGDEKLIKFKKYFKENFREDKNILVITDPPFAGQIPAFIDSLNWLFSKILPIKFDLENVKIAWIFPYFFEKEIQKLRRAVIFKDSEQNFLPIDFVVDYDNHPKYKNNLSGCRASPVRIFTNLDLKNIEISKKYDPKIKKCQKCQVYRFFGAIHCDICGTCFGHEKMRFRHCKLCGKCVKEKWKHCKKCQRCLPDYHVCRSCVFVES